MHDLDPGQPRPSQRPFVPRLVGGDGEGPAPVPAPARASAAQQVEMHDPTVREIADSLTDLFLGSKPRELRRSDASGASTSARAPSPAPLGGGTTSNPRPTRFFGQSGVSPGHLSNGSGPIHRPRAPVELLVLGHLPVLASAWITQYAAQAAASLGKPVALARLEPGGLSIDLFGMPKDAPAHRHESLSEAVPAAASVAGAWLIRVDDLAEASVAELPRLGAVTVLSGVSESSIVAAYRALKAIAQRAGSRAGADAPVRELSADLRIALLGATAERAAEASARVRRAAATFLGRPVGVVVCPEKIGMTGMRSLYRGPFEGDAAMLLDLVDRAPAVPVAPAAPAVAAPSPAACMQGEPERPAPPAIAAQDAELDWILDPGALPTPAARPAAAVHAGKAAPRAAGTEEPSACGAALPDAAAPDAAPAGIAIEPPLGRLASMLHLSPLPVRCPDAPPVELAADSAGRLHAIALDESSVEAAGREAPGRAGAAALLAAEAWVRANRDLLARALPFLVGGDTTLHLLTRVPAAARDLLGTRIRVHLVARAAAPGDVCVALN